MANMSRSLLRVAARLFNTKSQSIKYPPVQRHIAANSVWNISCHQELSTSCHRLQLDQEAGVQENENEELLEEAEEPAAEKPVLFRADVETSIRYIQSKAFQDTYKGQPVWVPYRRNHKGSIPPQKTRLSCIRHGKMATGNPCPICRDEYLTVDARNLDLLTQFISPETGQLFPPTKTGVCQKQYKNLVIALNTAWDQGLLEMNLPFRIYDYSHYYPQLDKRTTSNDK